LHTGTIFPDCASFVTSSNVGKITAFPLHRQFGDKRGIKYIMTDGMALSRLPGL
jgi:hypothetical protein